MRGRLLGALGALALAGCGGVQVQGFVRDEATGEPLPGAEVRVGEARTASSLTGFYELEVDPRDGRPQPLTVRRAGYHTSSVLVPFSPEARAVHGDLELRRREPRQDEAVAPELEDTAQEGPEQDAY
ncbi:MAG: carboxypeptidase-like regulatory domain-containing protein [Planctomycetes bacterium]|nr:carboxypeptidase-like regulatory domain-containing protein [Planctomycetota bacterium]